MSEKRKDNKGRVLREGEVQRKDGQYMYRYTDIGGVRRTIYSWRLVETDKIPPGKRSAEPLRSQIKSIQKDLEAGIDHYSARALTLNDYYDSYIETRTDIRPSTLVTYRNLYKCHVRDTIGSRSIRSLKYHDIRAFYLSLVNEHGISYKSVQVIHAIIHQLLQIAVRENVVQSNQSDGAFGDTVRSIKPDRERGKRHPLTVAQQSRLLDYLSSSKDYQSWKPLITVLLGTGMRIGEALGLRWEDCDFTHQTISVNHTLSYGAQPDGTHRFRVSPPKTSSGTRIIPMLSDVRRALLQVREACMRHGFNQCEVDGYTHFVFQSNRGTLLSMKLVNDTLARIIADCNRLEQASAENEHREPVLLPHFTAHYLRHTFCTRLCENETNLKIIQEIMGHARIQMTMDVYNEATREAKENCIENLEGKIRIS